MQNAEFEELCEFANSLKLYDVENLIRTKKIDKACLFGLNEKIIKKLTNDDCILEAHLNYFIDQIKNQKDIKSVNKPQISSSILDEESGVQNSGVPELGVQNLPERDFNDKETYKNWPTQYVFKPENQSIRIQTKLQRKRLLTEDDIQEMIGVLFKDMLTYSVYPTPYMYDQVASSIVAKYPYLKDESIGGYSIYKMQLRTRFKEYRRCKDNEEIMKKKAIYGKKKYADIHDNTSESTDILSEDENSEIKKPLNDSNKPMMRKQNAFMIKAPKRYGVQYIDENESCVKFIDNVEDAETDVCQSSINIEKIKTENSPFTPRTNKKLINMRIDEVGPYDSPKRQRKAKKPLDL